MELLIPGDDEEETEAFRQRVLDSFQSQAFGGNQADYREKVLAMPGVGTSKSTPSGMATFPASLIPDEAVESWYTSTISTVSGSVATWLTAVYTAAKEKKAHGGRHGQAGHHGLRLQGPHAHPCWRKSRRPLTRSRTPGRAWAWPPPIGHVVHVTGVTPEEVDIALHLTYASGWDWDAVKSYVGGRH